MRPFSAAVLVALLVALFGVSRAHAGSWEFQPGFALETRFDSNIGRTPTDEEPDFVYILRPTLKTRYQSDRLTVRAQLEPQRFGYARFSEGDAWSVLARGNIEYALTKKTSLFASDRLARTKNLPGAELIGINQLENGFETILFNTAQVGVRHQWTRRLSSTLTAGSIYRDTDLQAGLDTTGFFGDFSSQYVLTPRNYVGAGVNFRYDSARLNGSVQKNICRFPGGFPALPCSSLISPSNRGDFSSQLVQKSRTVNVFLSWTYIFSENWTFSFQGGPAVIDTGTTYLPEPPAVPGTFTTCSLGAAQPLPNSVFCGRDDTSSVTFFTRIRVEREWENLTLGAGYERTQSPPQSTIGTSVEDFVTADASWRFARLWSLDGRFRYVKRDTEVSQQDFEQYFASATVRRRLTEFISVAGFYRFFIQDRSGGPNTTGVETGASSLTDHIVGVWFRWELDPVRL